MPDVEENKQDLVDIDTSGPDVDVQLEEPKEKKVEIEETKVEEVKEEPKVEESKVEESKVEEKVEASNEKQEPKKEEELEQYSEGVKKRIAKLTKKWREAERQREAALEFAKGGQTELDKLKEKLAKLEPGYVNAMEGKLKTGLEAAKAQLLRAREAGDINAEVEAQKEIVRIGVEESKVSTLKSRYQQQAKETVVPKTLDEAIKNPPTDPKAEEWAEKNSWFGQDSAMTYTAFDLHEKLTKEEGFDPKTDEYYAEVDRRMRLDFPHKFGTTETKETTKPTQTVASATRSVKPGRNTVRLTSSQVAIAKKLGVPLEEYAKQLKITKGETSI
jgi:hypothetical protein